MSILTNTHREVTDYDDSVVAIALESSTLIMIMVAAICLNSATIFVILRTRSLLQTGHTLLILSLCVLDLGVVFSGMSFSLLGVFDGGKFLESHHVLCKYLNGFLTVTFSIAGLVTIFCIAVDRLLLVVFAQRFPPKRRRIYVMVAISWLVGLWISSMRASGVVSGFDFLNSTKDCAAPADDLLARNILIIQAGALAPSLLIIYAIMTYYIWRGDRRLLRHTLAKPNPIVKPIPSTDGEGPTDTQVDSQVSSLNSPDPGPSDKSLDTSSPVCKETPSLDPSEKSIGDEGISTDVGTPNAKYTMKVRRKTHQAHRRVAIMGAMLISASILCWAPFFLYHADCLRFIDNPWLGITTMWLAYCNTLADPLIYAFMNRRVRAEMCKMACKAKGQVLGVCRH